MMCFRNPQTEAHIFMDASNIGWGLTRIQRQYLPWSGPESLLHISVLELQLICLASSHWLSQLSGLSVMVATNNSTVVSYVNKLGGTCSINLFQHVRELILVCHRQGSGHQPVSSAHSGPVECPGRWVIPMLSFNIFLFLFTPIISIGHYISSNDLYNNNIRLAYASFASVVYNTEE